MASALPTNPSLDRLREEARKLQRGAGWRTGRLRPLRLLARHGVDVSGVDVTVLSFPEDPNSRDEQGALG